ncbi:uncharacterized protein [Pyxicephalus adspersus]|uniref:uncharacterized protein isoform X1 n=1 Tax=Pyxicephalus adspersus TaxID=30357 RepID=UPI003B5B51CF
MTFQQFQSICDFYYLLNKAAHWQYEVLDRLSFKDAVWEETPVTEYNRNSMVCISLLWRRQNHALLSQVSPHNPEDWIELARLSSLLPESIRKKGIQISSRCLLLWNILTSKSRRVCQSDLQQLISWKNANSKDPALEIPSLDFITLDFPRCPTKSVCDLKSLPHVESPQDDVIELLGNRKSSHSLNGLMNPWLSLPLIDFSNEPQQHVQMTCNVKHTKNIFDQICTSKCMSENREPDLKSIGVQVLDCKATGTQKTCGVQTDSYQCLSTIDEKIEHDPNKEAICYSLTNCCQKITSQSGAVLNSYYSDYSTCNQ